MFVFVLFLNHLLYLYKLKEHKLKRAEKCGIYGIVEMNINMLCLFCFQSFYI